MAVNKTLYVRDEDAPIWDKARELVGDKLSTFLTNHLKQFVASKEAAAGGFQRIILTYREKGKLPRSRAFYGRWIISLNEPFEVWTDAGEPDRYGVAVTAKGNIVTFNTYNSEPDTEGRYRWGDFRVYPSFDEALSDRELPADLIPTAMENLGVEVEELDI